MNRPILLTVLASLFATTAWSQVKIESIVNAATYEPGLPRGGALATMFVSGFRFLTPGSYIANPAQGLPAELDGFKIGIDYGQAAMLAVVTPASGPTAVTQINFQVPYERNGTPDVGPTAPFGTFSLDSASEPGPAFHPLPSTSRGGFFSDGKGYAAAQHASDFSPVSTQNPAHPGETIIVYGTDMFQVWPPSPIGIPAPAQPLIWRSKSGYLYLGQYNETAPGFGGKCLPPNAFTVERSFEGLAPGLVGVQQVNFVVPANFTASDYALYYVDRPPGDSSFGPCPTTAKVLIPVR